jgi:hypothetical protein
MATPLTLSALLPDTLGRVEEDLPSPITPPSGPVFWSLSGEVYVAMVDALFQAALMTGVIQSNNVIVTLAAGTTYFSLQNNTGIGIPKGCIAALRMRAPGQIRKTSLIALDNYFPGWQQATPTTQIQAWFPIGTSYFGIYPELSADIQVTMDFLISPINEYRPYTGEEPINLQQEFYDLVSQAAAAALRMKEGGQEAEQSDVVYQSFLSRLKALSLFQNRVDSLVYSPAFGAGGNLPNPRKVV